MLLQLGTDPEERQEISASCSFANHLNLCKNKVGRSDVSIDTVFFLFFQEHTQPCACAANPFSNSGGVPLSKLWLQQN